MSAIGILGGMGPQASVKLYELIIQGTQAYTPAAVDDDYPEIVLLSVPVPNFISNKNQLQAAKNMLLKRTNLLEQAGCTVNGIACNTAHILLPELQASTNVPFVSLPSLIAQRVKSAGYKRVGLLATPTTLASELYDTALDGITTLIRPNQALARTTEAAIYQQLQRPLSSAERNEFKRQVGRFEQQNQLDAVILGCTELPLVFGPSKQASILDSLQILSDGLLASYFQNRYDG